MTEPQDPTQDFVTFQLAGQLLGIPVLEVHDVLKAQKMTRVPIAPDWVAGLINLRGRIVTCINLRARLGLAEAEESAKCMSIVVEHDGEPYSLLIDQVGDVLSLPTSSYERNPVTLEALWAEVSAGVYRLDGDLLVVLDVAHLLALDAMQDAA